MGVNELDYRPTDEDNRIARFHKNFLTRINIDCLLLISSNLVGFIFIIPVQDFESRLKVIIILDSDEQPTTRERQY